MRRRILIRHGEAQNKEKKWLCLFPMTEERQWKCLEEKYGTPKPVQEHEKAVMDYAGFLAERIEKKGIYVNKKLLARSARLHDLARQEKEHAKKGAEILRREGFWEIADVIETHHDLPDEDGYRLDEKTLLFYADKRIKGERMVTLEERFVSSRKKCRCREAVRKHERQWETARVIEQQIITVIGEELR